MELVWEYPVLGIAFSLSSIPTETLAWKNMLGETKHWTVKWILGIRSNANPAGSEGFLLWLLKRDNFHSSFKFNI